MLAKRSWTLGFTVALLCSASGCGHRAYRVVTRPPTTDTRVDKTRPSNALSQVRADGRQDTQADINEALRKLSAALAVLYPTTTTTTSTPRPTAHPQLPLPPRVESDPTPISGHRCTGAVGAEIQAVFGPAAPWASSITYRESHCEPGARNPSGSSGLMQLLLPLHDDLFTAVGCTPAQWMIASCALRAAYLLYEGSGTAPWRL